MGGGSLAQSESGREPATTWLPSVTPSQVSPAAEEGSSNEGWKVLNRLRRHFGSAGTWKWPSPRQWIDAALGKNKSTEAFLANIMTVKVVVCSF